MSTSTRHGTSDSRTIAGINDLDGSTLARVLSLLPPEGILSAASTCRHLATSADEPLWRELFNRAWDEPVWAVESYRDLYLARYRAITFVSDTASALDASAGAPEKKAGNGTDALPEHLHDLDRIAHCCSEVARAINGSKHVEKTGETLEAAGSLRALHGMLLVVKARLSGAQSGADDRARGLLTAAPEMPPSKNDPASRALLAVCAALSALIVRCAPARAALLDEREASSAMRARLFRACFEVDAGPASELNTHTFGWPSLTARLAVGEAAPPRTPPASLDALAASLGGAPAPAAQWPPVDAARPRVDHALVLFFGPLCLLGAAGRETPHGAPLVSHPFLAPTSTPALWPGRTEVEGQEGQGEVEHTSGELVPVVASIPGRGPWPRGGRPPHGQRLRLERQPAPPTVASVTGAWFGCRLSMERGGHGATDVSAQKLTVDTVFRMTLTVTPEGKVSGWVADSVGDLTLRGEVDPNGGGAVVLEAAFTQCGGLPGAMFGTLQHGRARLRMCGWATATMIAGEWHQWSGGRKTEGVFMAWPNDDGKEGKRGMKMTSA